MQHQGKLRRSVNSSNRNNASPPPQKYKHKLRSDKTKTEKYVGKRKQGKKKPPQKKKTKDANLPSAKDEKRAAVTTAARAPSMQATPGKEDALTAATEIMLLRHHKNTNTKK